MSEAIRRRFGPQAHLYATSASQSAGDNLRVLEEWVGRRPEARALDVATGAGFTAFTLAPLVREVVGTDITEEMLAQARRLAAKPLAALIETKRLLKKSNQAVVLERIEEEARSFRRMMKAPAAREAFAAFMEKRKPDFSGL